jgi:hypothetical protein
MFYSVWNIKKFRNPLILGIIYHHQNPSELIYSVIYYHGMLFVPSNQTGDGETEN